MKRTENSKIILRIATVTIIVNIVLMIAKMVLGLAFDSLSVVSDAIHTASDLLTSLLVVVAVFLSSPKRDKKHNYGHEKVESLMTLFFSLVLVFVGGTLVWQGIEGIVSPHATNVNYYLISIIALSLLVKEAMFWIVRHYARKIKSDILKAEAWHHRSDSLSSVAVLIGLGAGYFLENNIVESIAVLVVAVMIFKVAFDIARPAIWQLTDRAADEKTSDRIRKIAHEVSGVESIDCLRTRMFGSKIFVDIEVAVDGNLTTIQSHGIAQEVHDTLERTADLRIKHCVVHINPAKEKL
jgi:cation diffusion facilitator family transporter